MHSTATQNAHVTQEESSVAFEGVPGRMSSSAGRSKQLGLDRRWVQSSTPGATSPSLFHTPNPIANIHGAAALRPQAHYAPQQPAGVAHDHRRRSDTLCSTPKPVIQQQPVVQDVDGKDTAGNNTHSAAGSNTAVQGGVVPLSSFPGVRDTSRLQESGPMTAEHERQSEDFSDLGRHQGAPYGKGVVPRPMASRPNGLIFDSPANVHNAVRPHASTAAKRPLTNSALRQPLAARSAVMRPANVVVLSGFNIRQWPAVKAALEPLVGPIDARALTHKDVHLARFRSNQMAQRCVALSGGAMVDGSVLHSSWPSAANWTGELTVLDYYDSTTAECPVSSSPADVLEAIALRGGGQQQRLDVANNAGRKMPHFKAHSEESRWAVRRFFSNLIESFRYFSPVPC